MATFPPYSNPFVENSKTIHFKFPHSKTHFVETTIPSLKHSLSLALQHFITIHYYSVNLLFPPNLEQPEIHYVDGDSISLTFAESNADFDYLVRNHPREVARFHPLIPHLSAVSVRGNNTIVAPVFAIQITVFRNSGISFGFTTDHVVADGNAFILFIKLWATINKFQREALTLEGPIIPFYERTTVKDPNKIGSIFWQHHKKTKYEGYKPPLPTSNLLATFILRMEEIQKLKKKVMVRCPALSHVSSFKVTCAYTWVCIVKARAMIGEEVVSENEVDHLVISIDSRGHLELPLPENYFGKGVTPCLVTAKSMELIEEDGFIIAANLIGEAIKEKVGKKEGILEGLEELFNPIVPSINLKRLVGVASSPRFAVYDTDFGFGRPEKREVISIDETGSISLHEAKDSKSDIEVGLSLPKVKFDAFVSIFTDGLLLDD